MKNMKKNFVLAVVFSLALCVSVSAAFAASDADLNRWLDEWVRIRCSATANAAAEYSKAAQKGDIVAPLMLERAAINAKKRAEAAKWRKVNQDNNIAAVLLEKAASDARAQTLMGHIYDEGLAGIAADPAKAFEWLRKASDQGLPLAQNYLGYMYGNGRGVAVNDAQAVKLYLKAAEQGLYFAQGNIGYRYEHGSGLPADKAKAVYWYQKAAAQGDQASLNDLRRMEAAGRTVTVSSGPSGGSPSSGGRAPAQQQARCRYCGQSNVYGPCPAAARTSGNPNGYHEHHFNDGKTCVRCGAPFADAFSRCPYYEDGKHRYN